jgi:hypothetical protein
MFFLEINFWWLFQEERTRYLLKHANAIRFPKFFVTSMFPRSTVYGCEPLLHSLLVPFFCSDVRHDGPHEPAEKEGPRSSLKEDWMKKLLSWPSKALLRQRDCWYLILVVLVSVVEHSASALKLLERNFLSILVVIGENNRAVSFWLV